MESNEGKKEVQKMSYTALYRKFRPTTFAEVKGQDAIVTTLKNQVKSGRIGHAYLFCGTRGTGKTSVAKILAKAVNCQAPEDGNPCGKCAMCQEIATGNSLNVIEIDAASNNGVDNIREIREEVAYRPAQGKYKVYIIDEVHMLSGGAFNALLKTLEEPPEYVIFILATTEAHKIPVTILSRCQRYDFKRISIDTISERIQELAAAENIQIEDKAIRYIARSADGAMRDALSLLDQCVAFYFNQEIRYEHVLEVLGAIDAEVFSNLFRKLLSMDVKQVLEALNDLIMEGKDLTQLTNDFIWYLRNLLLIKSAEDMEDVLDMSRENVQRLKEEATLVENDTLIRYIRVFSELANRMRFSTQKRVLLEVAFIKLCKPQMETDYGSLLDRLRALEKEVEELEFASAPVVTQVASVAPEKEYPPVVLEKALSADIRQVVERFSKILSRLGEGMAKGFFEQTKLSVSDDDKLLLVTDDSVKYSMVSKGDWIDQLKAAIAAETEKDVEIEVRLLKEGRPFESQYPDLSKIIQTEVVEEDF
ncbi:DNA polymerase-3 subunit gamma/tau [Lachnospiraceae bacterium PF1-21]